jgi:hypothetical protein
MCLYVYVCVYTCVFYTYTCTYSLHINCTGLCMGCDMVTWTRVAGTIDYLIIDKMCVIIQTHGYNVLK